MNRNEMIKWLSENTTREQWLDRDTLFFTGDLPLSIKYTWGTCSAGQHCMNGKVVVRHLGSTDYSDIITIDDVFEPVNEQPVTREEMIKWLSENTTREQWVFGNNLQGDNDDWVTWFSRDGIALLNVDDTSVSNITIDDVFEPVSEQPVYIDGGIYEIGVMNGEPQQFVYNLKLNMFERGSNESIGASNVHDSKVVTHFKLVNVPSDTYLTGTGDDQRKPRGLLNHRRERSGSTLNIVKPVGFGAIGDEPDSPSVLDKQEGGSHYKGKGVQPWEVIKSNDMGFFDGNALKYLMRHKDKNGAEDIRKAIHYLEAILEFEYGECDGNVRR